VGTLKKMGGQPYHFSSVYDLLDTGKWTVRTGPDFVEYRHELSDPKSGLSYIYTKTIRLTPGKQQMTIDHTLRNTGTKPIATNNYNHGFFMLDAQPTGPDVVVTFPFDEDRPVDEPGGGSERETDRLSHRTPAKRQRARRGGWRACPGSWPRSRRGC
jgi:hypothetical protein